MKVNNINMLSITWKSIFDILEREILENFSGDKPHAHKLLLATWIPTSFFHSRIVRLDSVTIRFPLSRSKFCVFVFVQYKLEDGVILPIPE